MPSEIFYVNQSITTLSLFWILILYVILDLSFKISDYILIFLVSIVLLISHESVIFYSPLLIAGSLFKYFNSDRKSIYLILLLLGIILLIHGINWIIDIPVGQESGAYINTLLYRLSPHELSYGLIRISVISLFIFILLYIEVILSHKICKVFIKLVIYILLAYSIYIGTSLFFDINLLNPTKEFQSRALISFGAPVWMGIAIASSLYAALLKNSKIFSCCLVLLISSSLWQISNSIYWAEYLGQVRFTLSASQKTLLPHEDVLKNLSKVGKQKLWEFNGGWTWPVLGLAVQTNYEVFQLIMPDSFFDYFLINKFKNEPPIIPFVKFTNGTPFNFAPLKNRCTDNPRCFSQ